MKSFIQNLFFDSNLVEEIKKVNIPEGLLYNQLISGKITLKEYLQSI